MYEVCAKAFLNDNFFVLQVFLCALVSRPVHVCALSFEGTLVIRIIGLAGSLLVLVGPSLVSLMDNAALPLTLTQSEFPHPCDIGSTVNDNPSFTYVAVEKL